jgi:cytochrome b subunit of formate dehydrogenase
LTIRVRETWTIGEADAYTPKKEEYYIRMNIHERIQHHLVWSSFVILAITGFMVEFPEEWLRYFDPYRETVFYWRGLLHRIFAVVMIVNIGYQALYLAFSKEGRGYFLSMLPELKDAKDFFQNMAYYLQRGEKPLFDRFNYKEKLEYWTGWIGNIIITVTGFFLWFQEFFPKFIFDLSILIHTMEAILASSAIMVWHFYEVHLKPGKFPMSNVWLDGKISEHELEEEHPLQYEKVKEQTITPSQIPDL